MLILTILAEEHNCSIMDAIIFIDLSEWIAVRAILNATISAKAVDMAINWRSINLIKVKLSHAPCIPSLRHQWINTILETLAASLNHPLTVLHFKHCHDTVPLTASWDKSTRFLIWTGSLHNWHGTKADIKSTHSPLILIPMFPIKLSLSVVGTFHLIRVCTT